MCVGISDGRARLLQTSVLTKDNGCLPLMEEEYVQNRRRLGFDRMHLVRRFARNWGEANNGRDRDI